MGNCCLSVPFKILLHILKYSCILPQHPTFGSWSVYRSANQLNPGMLAPSGTVLQVTCRDTYKLDGDAALVCINARWTTEVGQCLSKFQYLFRASFNW
jgi:hypothetical protein